MQITKNFTLEEFLFSQTAERQNINNFPSNIHILNAIEALCIKVLQPLRDHYGRPVIITSGYRCEALNRAIGGSSTSQHMKGEAADFTVSGVPITDTIQVIRNRLEYDQLILEYNSWIHCSYRVGGNRNQYLVIN